MLRHRRLILAICAGLVVGATVLGVVSLASAGGSLSSLSNLTGNQAVDPITYSTSSGWAPTVPSTASTAADVVQAIVSRAGLGTSFSAKISSVQTTTGRSGSSLTFQIPTAGTDAANVRAAWTADEVEGVIAEALANRGMPRVVSSTYTGVLPSGQTIDLQGGMGDTSQGQVFSDDTDAAIKQHLTVVLSKANLTPVSLVIMRVGQPAPAVVVETDDPTAAVEAANSVMNSLFRDASYNPLYEGYYFEIDSVSGTPLLVASASFRTGSGRQWVDPSIQGSSSLNDGGGASSQG